MKMIGIVASFAGGLAPLSACVPAGTPETVPTPAVAGPIALTPASYGSPGAISAPAKIDNSYHPSWAVDVIQ
jgi:hypothetical protein